VVGPGRNLGHSRKNLRKRKENRASKVRGRWTEDPGAKKIGVFVKKKDGTGKENGPNQGPSRRIAVQSSGEKRVLILTVGEAARSTAPDESKSFGGTDSKRGGSKKGATLVV